MFSIMYYGSQVVVYYLVLNFLFSEPLIQTVTINVRLLYAFFVNFVMKLCFGHLSSFLLWSLKVCFGLFKRIDHLSWWFFDLKLLVHDMRNKDIDGFCIPNMIYICRSKKADIVIYTLKLFSTLVIKVITFFYRNLKYGSKY